MGTCKTCSRKYHSCVSCGLEDWEHDFCNTTCLNQHLNKHYESLLKFLGTLTEEQKQILYEHALENGGPLEGSHDANVLSFKDLILRSIIKVNSNE